MVGVEDKVFVIFVVFGIGRGVISRGREIRVRVRVVVGVYGIVVEVRVLYCGYCRVGEKRVGYKVNVFGFIRLEFITYGGLEDGVFFGLFSFWS